MLQKVHNIPLNVFITLLLYYFITYVVKTKNYNMYQLNPISHVSYKYNVELEIVIEILLYDLCVI